MRQQRSRPLIETVQACGWRKRSVASPVVPRWPKPIRYALNHWSGLILFLGDGRLALDTNTVERAMRPVATPGSLCTSSSSIWKHWKLIAGIDVTRASFTPDRLHHGRCVQVPRPGFWNGAPGTTCSHGAKGASLDQLAYPVAGNAAVLSCLAQGQPGPVLLGGLVGMDAADTADRADPVRCPGLTLPGWQGHPVESGRDVVSRDQRLAMLRMTARASSRMPHACSPVRGARRRSSECCPPFQWMIRTISPGPARRYRR